jgi:hypothetical protein
MSAFPGVTQSDLDVLQQNVTFIFRGQMTVLKRILGKRPRFISRWFIGPVLFIGLILAIAFPSITSAKDLSDDPQFGEIWKKSQALRPQLSMDTTPVYFSVGNVNYKVPRNYITNMDNYQGGPQILVAFKVSFPGFLPYTEATKDCFTLAPLYRPKGCIPLEFNIISNIAVSDDEAFSNASKLFHSQTPKRGPNGFEKYEIGSDTNRIESYRKKTSGHTLIIDCFVNDLSRSLFSVCNNHSRLPNQNAINYILSGGEYEFNGEQLKYAEQIDEGFRELIKTFMVVGDKK